MNINQRFGIVLKELMLEHKISRLKLAKRTGVSRTSLYMIENGKQSPSLELICKIANGLNIHPKELITRAYDKTDN